MGLENLRKKSKRIPYLQKEFGNDKIPSNSHIHFRHKVEDRMHSFLERNIVRRKHNFTYKINLKKIINYINLFRFIDRKSLQNFPCIFFLL